MNITLQLPDNIWFWLLTLHDPGHWLPGMADRFGSDFIISNDLVSNGMQGNSFYVLKKTVSHYLDAEDYRYKVSLHYTGSSFSRFSDQVYAHGLG